MLESVEGELEFLKIVFNADIKEALRNPEGAIWHAEVWIGESVIMMGRAQKDYAAAQSMLYVWTDDVDAAYKRALKAGASSVTEPKST